MFFSVKTLMVVALLVQLVASLPLDQPIERDDGLGKDHGGQNGGGIGGPGMNNPGDHGMGGNHGMGGGHDHMGGDHGMGDQDGSSTSTSTTPIAP